MVRYTLQVEIRQFINILARVESTKVDPDELFADPKKYGVQSICVVSNKKDLEDRYAQFAVNGGFFSFVQIIDGTLYSDTVFTLEEAKAWYDNLIL